MIDPFGLIARLKRLAAIFVGVIFGMALFTHLAPALLQSTDQSWLLALLILSPVAYFIRESRLRQKRKQPRQTRGAERTPIMPHHAMEDDE